MRASTLLPPGKRGPCMTRERGPCWRSMRRGGHAGVPCGAGRPAPCVGGADGRRHGSARRAPATERGRAAARAGRGGRRGLGGAGRRRWARRRFAPRRAGGLAVASRRGPWWSCQKGAAVRVGASTVEPEACALKNAERGRRRRGRRRRRASQARWAQEGGSAGPTSAKRPRRKKGLARASLAASASGRRPLRLGWHGVRTGASGVGVRASVARARAVEVGPNGPGLCQFMPKPTPSPLPERRGESRPSRAARITTRGTHGTQHSQSMRVRALMASCSMRPLTRSLSCHSSVSPRSGRPCGGRAGGRGVWARALRLQSARALRLPSRRAARGARPPEHNLYPPTQPPPIQPCKTVRVGLQPPSSRYQPAPHLQPQP
jgi:hypothetical protein